jgi:phosphatidylinositol glycan class A protein
MSPSPTTDDIIQLRQSRRRFSIAMVCDFFYPRLGGVENHVWSLAYHLKRLGHKVTVITHAYKCPDNEYSYGDDDDTTSRHKSKRSGVRYLPGGIKVYYCPFLPMVDEDCLPTFTVTFPLLRWIFIREAIDVVHSHQATSTLANEAVTYAAELGLASVYTDHSLFGFDDIASVILNKVQKVTMSTVGAVICVSHTCRDNFILRAKLPPSTVHVIPNAVDPSKFTPDITKRNNDRITIVVLSRLVYRKGVDLLVGIIPIICKTFPQVDFVIGGDGNKKLALEEMVERERLQDRVEFLGFVPSGSVRDTLVRGHVFLNCSLTESFCIAILEAASAGLYVVSTNVGGVPEVLPPDMIYLSDPNIHSLVEGLSIALAEKIDSVDPYEFHQRVSEIYSWQRVATETELVYSRVFDKPRLSFLQRLARYKTVGSIAGYVACILAITVHFVVLLVEWWQPIDLIDVVPNNMICLEQEKAKNKKRQ